MIIFVVPYVIKNTVTRIMAYPQRNEYTSLLTLYTLLSCECGEHLNNYLNYPICERKYDIIDGNLIEIILKITTPITYNLMSSTYYPLTIYLII
jgi:hypothetical protein